MLAPRRGVCPVARRACATQSPPPKRGAKVATEAKPVAVSRALPSWRVRVAAPELVHAAGYLTGSTGVGPLAEAQPHPPKRAPNQAD